MLLNAEIASMRENILLSFMLICRGGEGGGRRGEDIIIYLIFWKVFTKILTFKKCVTGISGRL